MKRFQSDNEGVLLVPVIVCDRVRDRREETAAEFNNRVIKAFKNLITTKGTNIIRMTYENNKLIVYCAVLVEETTAEAAQRVIEGAYNESA